MFHSHDYRLSSAASGRSGGCFTHRVPAESRQVQASLNMLLHLKHSAFYVQSLQEDCFSMQCSVKAVHFQKFQKTNEKNLNGGPLVHEYSMWSLGNVSMSIIECNVTR